MKIEYEKAVEAARDVIYGDDQSHIKTRDALENLLAAIEAQEPLFILYTGEVWDGEQDDWDVEPNGQAAVDDYCAANPGKRIGLFPCPPAQPGVWARALRLADECEESAQVWAHEIHTRQRAAAELRRLHVQAAQDEALLRQALEALELRCGTNADERKELIPALRERLGAKA